VVLFDGNTGEIYEWDGVWRHTTPPTKPSAREHYALAYAPAFGGVVLYGGTEINTGLGIGLGSVYVWNGVTWTALPSGPTLLHHSMAYDARRKRLVVFGGRSQYEGSTRDVWEFDGTVWQEVTPVDAANAPAPTTYSVMAYDATQGAIVLYMPSPETTWEYDGTTWTKFTSTLNMSNPTLTYVSKFGRVVMYGGIDAGDAITSMMHLWNGTTWETRGPFAGRNRMNHAMSEDGRGRLITYGGCTSKDNSDLCTSAVGDTAFYDGTNWAVEQTPPGLVAVGAAQAGAKLVRIGGAITIQSDPAGPNITWELTRRGWTSFQDGPGANDSPPPLVGPVMVHDQKRDQIVLFGGKQAANVIDNRTWLRTGTTWTVTQPSPSPTARYLTSMAYHEQAELTVLVGGADAAGNRIDDTWTWNGTAWTQIVGPSPGGLAGAALGYDRANGLLVLYGGAASDNVARGDVWVFNGTAWTELTNRVGEHPPSGIFMSLTPDLARGRLLLTGGFFLPFDTWEWKGNATESRWQRVSTLRLPQSRGYDTVVRSADGSGITTLGGGVVANGGDPTNELWELRSSGPRGADGCASAIDIDGDGLMGCDDPDCWYVCSPDCPPGTSCPSTSPQCGDGVCSVLETCQNCATDCATCDSLCGDFVCDPGETCLGDCP